MATQTSAQQDNAASPRKQTNNAREDLYICIICFKIIEEATMTRCGHRFCRNCIEMWLKTHPTCPTCRERVSYRQLIKDYTFEEIINEHESKCKALAELETCKEKLEQDCQSMIEELRHIKEEVLPEANTSVEEERRQKSNLRNELQSKCEELAELQTCKKKLEQDCQSMTEELRYLKEEVIPEANTTIEEERQLKSYLRKELESKCEEQAVLQTCREKLEHQYNTVTKVLRQEKSDLQNELERKYEELKKVQTCRKRLEQKSQTMGTELKHLKVELIPQNDKVIRALQTENAAQHSQIESLKRDMKCLQLELARSSEEHKQTLDHRARILDKLQRECEELSEVKTSRENLDKEFNTLKKEMQYLKDKLIPYKDITIQEILRQNSALQDALKSKREELVELHTCKMKLEQQCINMGKELQHLKEEMIPNKDKLIDEIQQQKSYLQDELQNKSTKLTESETFRENLKQRCHKLWTEVQHLEGEVIPRKDTITERIREQNTGLRYDLHRRHKEETELKLFTEYLEQEGHTLRTELRHFKEEVVPNTDITIGKI